MALITNGDSVFPVLLHSYKTFVLPRRASIKKNWIILGICSDGQGGQLSFRISCECVMFITNVSNVIFDQTNAHFLLVRTECVRTNVVRACEGGHSGH